MVCGLDKFCEVGVKFDHIVIFMLPNNCGCVTLVLQVLLPLSGFVIHRPHNKFEEDEWFVELCLWFNHVTDNHETQKWFWFGTKIHQKSRGQL